MVNSLVNTIADTLVNDTLDRLKKQYGYKTDTELSEFLGVSPQTISKWRSRNSMDLILILRKMPYDVDLNWLLRGHWSDDVEELNEIIDDYKEENELFKTDNQILRDTISDIINDTTILKKENDLLKAKIEVLKELITSMSYKGRSPRDVYEMPNLKLADTEIKYSTKLAKGINEGS